jgi:hypothetical protein
VLAATLLVQGLTSALARESFLLVAAFSVTRDVVSWLHNLFTFFWSQLETQPPLPTAIAPLPRLRRC